MRERETEGKRESERVSAQSAGCTHGRVPCARQPMEIHQRAEGWGSEAGDKPWKMDPRAQKASYNLLPPPPPPPHPPPHT